MAERFGGRFSPGAPAPGGGPRGGPVRRAPVRRARVGARSNLLFVVPLIFAARAFFQPPAAMATDLAATAILLLAAWLTREGLRAHEAYDARPVARRPAIPRKIFAAVLTGAGLAVAGWAGEVLAPAIFAVLGAALHLAAFGPDPLRDKHAGGGAGEAELFQTDRVARVVAEGEGHLAAMAAAIRATGDRVLVARVERFAATARAMFRIVEADPRDLTAARRYLGVYLQGARDATAKYAELALRGGDPKARADYVALIEDLETNFTARTEALMRNDRTDLDVEIGVLRDRLAREGVRTE